MSSQGLKSPAEREQLADAYERQAEEHAQRGDHQAAGKARGTAAAIRLAVKWQRRRDEEVARVRREMAQAVREQRHPRPMVPHAPARVRMPARPRERRDCARRGGDSGDDGLDSDPPPDRARGPPRRAPPHDN